jgi:hypothetical protein
MTSHALTCAKANFFKEAMFRDNQRTHNNSSLGGLSEVYSFDLKVSIRVSWDARGEAGGSGKSPSAGFLDSLVV